MKESAALAKFFSVMFPALFAAFLLAFGCVAVRAIQEGFATRASVAGAVALIAAYMLYRSISGWAMLRKK